MFSPTWDKIGLNKTGKQSEAAATDPEVVIFSGLSFNNKLP